MLNRDPARRSSQLPVILGGLPAEAWTVGRLTAAHRERIDTWANGVTALRTVVGVVLFALAALWKSPALNFAGLAVYWVLDIADGAVARKMGQETRLGAQFDILADRLLVSFFYLNYAYMHPELLGVVALFLFEFTIVDQYLSNQFLRWPILSPNYFYYVDRRIWALNWSTPGKIFNTGLITLLLIFVPSPIPAYIVVGVLILLKFYCCALLLALPAPERDWTPQVEQDPSAVN